MLSLTSVVTVQYLQGTQSLKVSGRRHRERTWNGTKILWELECQLSFISMAMEAQGTKNNGFLYNNIVLTLNLKVHILSYRAANHRVGLVRVSDCRLHYFIMAENDIGD